jgi:DNA repair protein RecN (Recombination protein N)
MPNASVMLQIEEIPLGNNGIDNITFLFTANKGVAPQELKNVASGGEFSRLMLLIKYILADKTALPTIVFDEIDTGISGEIAIKVGAMMQQMARKHQIIAITHLPQIAARAQAHYYVYKDNAGARTVSKIKRLSEEERVGEIAQMISGEPPTDTSKNNARELLEMSR